MTSVAGSPLWQMIMLWVAALFLAWSVWRGWRAGVVRSALKVMSIVGSGYLGLWAAQIAAAPFGGFKEISGIITGVVVGIGVALISFLAFWILSAVLFKRTAQQKSGLFRFFWGLGGAFFGLILGLTVLWGAISLIRLYGAVAESRIAPISSPHTAATALARRPTVPAANGTQAAPPPAQPQGIIPQVWTGVAKMKQSLEMGPVGSVIKSVDPVPEEGYVIVQEIGQVTADPHLMQRMASYPPIQHAMQNAKFTEILNDPSVLKAAEERNMTALMSNPVLINTLKDPAFVAEIEKIDLRAALKFALATPSPSPAPSTPNP